MPTGLIEVGRLFEIGIRRQGKPESFESIPSNGMSSWPTIHSKEATSVLRKGKHREEASIEVQVADYPVVEYGGLTSANLNHEGRRLHWTFLSEERTGTQVHDIT